MIVMASHMQEQEVGDGTNFVLVFAGALLELAEELLRLGLSVSEVSDRFITYPCFKFAYVCIPTVSNLSQYYSNSQYWALFSVSGFVVHVLPMQCLILSLQNPCEWALLKVIPVCFR